MDVCMHPSIHTHIHPYTHAYIHAHTHTYIHTHTHMHASCTKSRIFFTFYHFLKFKRQIEIRQWRTPLELWRFCSKRRRRRRQRRYSTEMLTSLSPWSKLRHNWVSWSDSPERWRCWRKQRRRRRRCSAEILTSLSPWCKLLTPPGFFQTVLISKDFLLTRLVLHSFCFLVAKPMSSGKEAAVL